MGRCYIIIIIIISFIIRLLVELQWTEPLAHGSFRSRASHTKNMLSKRPWK